MNEGPLNREEQTFLRSRFGMVGWLRLFTGFKAERDHCVSSWSGGTCYRTGPTGEPARGWYHIVKEGIGWMGPENGGMCSHHTRPDEFTLFVSWPRIDAHLANRRTPERLQRARDHLKVWLDNRLDEQSHYYPGRWRGIPYAYPVCSHGHDWDEHDTWTRDVSWPRGREIDAAGMVIVDEFFPDLTEDTATDLLDLLTLSQ